MPEKALQAGYAGMASITSARSMGSCDSMVSITSNHSAMSDESYDYLSAEEKDALMYLEETIESLDAEGDSGLSTDESERVEEPAEAPQPVASTEQTICKNPYESEAPSPGSLGKPTAEKNNAKSSTISGWTQEMPPKSSFNSLPKNLIIPRVEIVKKPLVPVATPPAAVLSTPPEKPKRWSLVPENEPGMQTSELNLIPPPEPFRDAKPVIKHLSLRRDTLAASGEDVGHDGVDSVDLTRESRITLEKVLPVAASGNSIPMDPTHAPLNQPRQTPPASPGKAEALKEAVGHRYVPWQHPDQVHPVAPVNNESPKEQVGLRAPRQQTDQALLAPLGNIQSAKEPVDFKPFSQQSSQLPPAAHHNPEASQPPKERVFHRPISPLTTEPVRKNGDSPKDGHFTLQAQQEKSQSQEALQQPLKTVDPQFKQGPPTAPKPPKLPPHIIVKPSHVNHNIEPQQRYRTQSLINVPFSSWNTSSVKAHVVKDEETSRQEALQKLRLQQGKDVSQIANLVKSPAAPMTKEIPIPQTAIEKLAKNGSVDDNQNYQRIGLQEKSNISTNPVKTFSGLRSREFSPPPQDKAGDLSTSPAKTAGGLRSREFPPSSQDKASDLSTSSVKTAGGLRSREFSPPPKDKASDLSTIPVQSYGPPKTNEIPVPQSGKENPPRNDIVNGNQSSPKSGWQDKMGTFGASPEWGSSGLRSREFPPRQAELEREALPEQTKALSSSQTDLSSRPGLQLTHSTIPGLKEVNFKANTLERSGIGLSGYMKGGEETKQNSSSSSIFGKPLSSKLSPNFLRNTRPRPASLGAGVDFKAIQESSTAPTGDLERAKPESRRSSPFQLFSSKPRPTSLISVKITPKNSADQHREALKKLGLLQE